MDKDQIQKIVEQYCEVEILTPKKVSGIRLDENDINDVKIDGEWTTIDQNTNPSLGFKIKKIKDVYRSCELECGKIVPNQVIESRICETPYRHWRTRCNACGDFVNPTGDGFIQGGHQIQSAYVKHYKAIKPKEQVQVIENENSITRSQEHSKKNNEWVKDQQGKISFKRTSN